MIELTKLNKKPITINSLYIERVEQTPDSVITLITGRKILVLESAEEIRQLVTEYYQKIHLLQVVNEDLLRIVKEGQEDE